MEYTKEERAIIYLSAMSGKDYRSCVSLLLSSRDPASLMTEEEERRAAEYLSELGQRGIFAVTLASDDYPAALKQINDPPLLLYGAGRRELLSRKMFCIVGSRITPPWAEKIGKELSRTLSEHFVIVTGLAEGGDNAAIAGAVESGNLVCVLPCGLSQCYPASHAGLKERILQKGLLLSEYPPDTPAAKYVFHARNRILAGLSEGVLVLSAGERSGALITASRALDYGRDVFALPYNPGISRGEGCNELIKKGAFLVTDAEDILSVYGMESAPRGEEALEGREGEIVSLLRANGEMHAAQIANLLGMKIFEATAMLSSLELKGYAVKSGGNKYSAV